MAVRQRKGTPVSYKNLILEVDTETPTVTLNRPACRNMTGTIRLRIERARFARLKQSYLWLVISSGRRRQLLDGLLYQLGPFLMNTEQLGQHRNGKWDVRESEFSHERNVHRPRGHAFYVPELTSLER